ncbi:MAG: SPOR domain-containing protein [Methylococcaceae bacterium]|nr:SPOR domain-containing protein [Methylococcaceae bacterium]
MAKDYKYRAHNQGTSRNESSNPLQSVSFWKWMLTTAFIISFVVFLVYWQFRESRHGHSMQNTQQFAPPNQSKTALAENRNNKEPAKSEPAHKSPRFDFYTILPEKEVVVPDYEINTRAREERVGKAKEAHYIMQAGSFRTFKETDQLRAKLGLLGIESTVHKAKVGNVIWYRVKIGPYTHMTSVSSIKSRLRQNGIDVVVTETGQ